MRGQQLVKVMVLPAQGVEVRQRPPLEVVGMRRPAQQVVAWHCWAEVMVAEKEKAVLLLVMKDMVLPAQGVVGMRQ
jgi:hypothetical protein